MKRSLKFILPGILILAGCDGYLSVSGTVEHENAPLKGATVKVISKKGEPLGSAKTDSTGHYSIGKSTTPFSRGYYVIFEKRGYQTDTVTVQKSRGISAVGCDHSMEKKN
jgi:uncharacterized protein YfaS (alpha-2-macroglobulin family)